ncbi:hypothetical protein ACQPZP_33175 [Spirillospora sp. CA-142024]|uniref:hypothetical protein n=1 Tax=Spirillospora sp. CA-142024 TaxID=3240036 RepID=UPI003D93C44E
MNFVRRPIDISGPVIWALGVASIALAGGVTAKACSVIVGDDSGNVLKLLVVFAICAVIGAVTSAVRGVIVRAVLGYPFPFLDFLVAGGNIVAGVVIGALIGSAHDSDAFFGGLMGTTAGFCIALGGVLVSRSK